MRINAMLKMEKMDNFGGQKRDLPKFPGLELRKKILFRKKII